jgi:hypothetical protein
MAESAYAALVPFRRWLSPHRKTEALVRAAGLTLRELRTDYATFTSFTLSLITAAWPDYCYTCSLRGAAIVLRSTSKMTAVDQPNNSTPFIAVIGPSKCQRTNGVTSP